MSADLLSLPLRGQTVLNLRAAEDAAALTVPLRNRGATVIEHPVLKFAPPESWVPFDSKARTLKPGDCVAFTSATAVRMSLDRLATLGIPSEGLKVSRLAAVGRGTAQALAAAGLTPAIVPKDEFQAEGLRDALLAQLRPGEGVWLPRAQSGRESLIEDLAARGHPVEVTPVYRTIAAPGGLGPVNAAILQGRIDWIVFTSSSMVEHFVSGLDRDAKYLLSKVRIACLGKITAQTAREAGLRVDVVPARQDLVGLVEALAESAKSAMH